MPEAAPLYPEMRVREYLAFRAEMKRVPRPRRKAEVGRTLDLARVADVAEVVIGHLSKGYRQRVGLADALLGAPPVLILDEPTAGLDPNQIREVRALVKGLAGEQTVVLSTHILPEVEAVCTRALVIAKGKLVAEGSIESLRSSAKSAGARVVVRGDAALAEATAKKTGGVKSVSVERARRSRLGELSVALKASADGANAIEALVASLVRAGLGVREVMPRVASLEQVFSELTVATRARRAGRRRRAAARRGARAVRGFWPIYKRELFAMFVTPLAWVLITAFLLVQGIHIVLLARSP